MARKSLSKKKSITSGQDARQATVAPGFLKRYASVVALLVVYSVMALSSVVNKCTTYDEIAHLTAGYSYWSDNDYRLMPQSGNLGQRWFALPLLLGDYKLPPQDQPSWRTSNSYLFGSEFFYGLGNDLEAMLLAGRAMTVLLGVALCLVVYHWSSSLFGRAGGLISLTLCAFSPTILANGRLMTLDLPVGLFFLLFCWRFWIILHRMTVWTILASCLATAGLLLTKMSGVLAIPMAIVLIAIRLISREPFTIVIGQPRKVESRLRWLVAFGTAVFVHVFFCVFAIWAFNGFRYSAIKPSVEGRDQLSGPWERLLDNSGAVGSVLDFTRDHRLLPEGYLHGFAYVLKHSQRRLAFMDGQLGPYGWRSFFLYSLLYKTPLPLFLILAISLLAVAKRSRPPPHASKGRIGASLFASFYRTAPLWVLLVIYWAVAIHTNLNIGHRHILPTYPPMFVLAGAVAFWFKQKLLICRVLKVLTILAVLAVAMESLLIWPHYLAYFNQLAGGPKNGYRHLVDSSLDWGQDLPGLKKWLERHKGESTAYLSYFGTGNPHYYKIPVKLLPGRPDTTPRATAIPWKAGIYCISATRLQLTYPVRTPWSSGHEHKYRQLLGLVKQYSQATGGKTDPPKAVLGQTASRWANTLLTYDRFRFARLATFLRQREPDDSVGHSILIYHLNDRDVEQALFGPLDEFITNAQ